LWEYLHNEELARTYERSLADSPLIHADQAFIARHFDPPGRVLDLGCGTGRLLIPLARRGFDVVGVDLSDAMLRVAAENCTRAGVRAQLLRANLVELDCLRSGTFDCALCLFSTLGMIQGAANRQRVLAHVHRVLRPGGRFALHAHNRWFNLWDPAGRRWLVGDVLRSLLPGHTPGDRIMPYHQGVANLSLHLFTRRELRQALRAAGFRRVTVEPISLRPDGRLRWPALFGWLRAFGYLALAEK
jgi:ubiquinone/menaquinone biosynthesis C-methylase UbiE